MQLKITLRYSRPPIWRRVLIRPGASFWDLHSIIQDLFGWEDCHLHNFERAYKRSEDRHIFEIPHPEDFRNPVRELGWMFDPTMPKDYRHDERKERVSDWLTAEHPHLWYTYDFGDSWEHEITLEKVIDANPFTHAKYLGGKRRGLEEDSRPHSLPDCTTIIKAANKPDSELWQAILRNEGKARAEKLLARAEQEAASKAPRQIRFTGPKERYKAARAMGMFD